MTLSTTSFLLNTFENIRLYLNLHIRNPEIIYLCLLFTCDLSIVEITQSSEEEH